MRNGAHPLRVRTALALMATVLAVGCDGSEVAEPVDGPAFAVSAEQDLIRQVRQATARFHAPRLAEQAGYVPSECVAVPGLGGMGEHWVNESLVDPGFDPTAPEALLYEPDGRGNYRLVAVEYIVIDVGQDPPMFAGQEFDVGGTPVPVDHWSLHLWLYKTNPSGTFAPFNPDVVCPAGASGH